MSHKTGAKGHLIQTSYLDKSGEKELTSVELPLVPGTLNAYREKILGRTIMRGRNLGQQSFQKFPQICIHTEESTNSCVHLGSI